MSLKPKDAAKIVDEGNVPGDVGSCGEPIGIKSNLSTTETKRVESKRKLYK